MEIALWVGFILFILGMLAFDLGVLNRKAHVIRTREALIWSGFVMVLALTFSVVVYYLYENGVIRYLDPDTHIPVSGRKAALDFLTGWIIEQSLSLDNIFVIALIFAYFNVPRIYQHRTLFWGIMGALIMRGLMIWAGVTLIELFHWVIYVFGALLLFTALRMAIARDEKVEPERNPLVRLARRLYPVTRDFEGERFFTRMDGRRAITPLFLVLLVIESTDVLFAVDSIPAILAITRDRFLVFTSNVFAILNLRSLYFALSGLLEQFRHLKYSLVFILAYVGVKMLLIDVKKIPTELSLGLIAAALAAGIISSWLASRREARERGAQAVGLSDIAGGALGPGAVEENAVEDKRLHRHGDAAGRPAPESPPA
ncbi:MAG: TerC family protein [Planctomycetota bacterium]